MNEEVYEHLPRWRRIIHDLAKEAGIKNFVNAPSEESSESSENDNSSAKDSETGRRDKER
jgi:hypothetical protein